MITVYGFKHLKDGVIGETRDLRALWALEETALYSLLVEQPPLDAQAGPLSALIGLYSFELTPPHADLLGRVAQLAGAAGAPFVGGIGPDAFRTPEHEWHPLIRQAWSALRALPAASYLGVATPRFLLTVWGVGYKFADV